MDKLPDIQQQLSRIAADVAEHSQLDSVAPSPAAEMTPVLIHIEQLLDEIRASTRAIVAKASRQGRPEPRPTKRRRTDDFRVKLESEDVVDYESETETEDEAAADQTGDAEEMDEGEKEEGEEEEGEEEEEHDDDDDTGDAGGLAGSKLQEGKSEEHGDEFEEKPHKRMLDPEAAAALEKQLRKSVKSYLAITRKVADVDEKTDLNRAEQVMAIVGRWSGASMIQLLKLLRGGGVPSVEVATDFCDATVLLPSTIAVHRSQQGMNQKWFSLTMKRIQQISALAKANCDIPKCLSDAKLDVTRERLQEHSTNTKTDFLRQMEVYIERMKSQDGVLEPDRVEKRVGKLASLFHHDFKLCSKRKTPPRTEENWRRFAQIGEVLAEWILVGERATSGPNLPAHLESFERQLRGFAKKNPGRVPASLLQ
ncbi:hypothetical protein PHYSODRAFT_297762 [Phytophthora sojae]|uniref:Uncharacterized protein n=1 Tax=Phytophthora sojae (strain P6497) TaxID=1094619 RepID=G4Z8R0_PHYSP|nr:hypothetical protein PHYSODRAFT_297762 [Phytophthora sojae]EGZ19092.1 hypothetical protein PHYSODRAFT_297762 [Phytophthora sojae]|eukprot:XP_009521809.1 hypothetical protein PHYSODRAFT_297762 [Phytophthora sojae]